MRIALLFGSHESRNAHRLSRTGCRIATVSTVLGAIVVALVDSARGGAIHEACTSAGVAFLIAACCSRASGSARDARDPRKPARREPSVGFGVAPLIFRDGSRMLFLGEPVSVQLIVGAVMLVARRRASAGAGEDGTPERDRAAIRVRVHSCFLGRAKVLRWSRGETSAARRSGRRRGCSAAPSCPRVSGRACAGVLRRHDALPFRGVGFLFGSRRLASRRLRGASPSYRR